MQFRRLCSRPSLLPAALVLAAAACSASTSPADRPPADRDVTRVVQPGLEQRVTITPDEVVSGEDVTIRSVITNTGSQPVALSSRICGLELGGDIRLDRSRIACEGYSMGGTIAPGDSRQSTDVRRVTSGWGIYTLRVKHALEPEHWVELRVVVRAR